MATVGVLFAESDDDAAIARESAEHVVQACVSTGHDTALFALEEVTERQVRGCDVIFPCDSFPCPRWAVDRVAKYVGIKAFLHEESIPYVGSPPSAVQVCKSKVLTKARLEDSGIPTPRRLCEDADVSELSFPIIVKPDRGSNSRGVSFVEYADELPAAVAEAQAVAAGQIVFECFIPGVEVTVAVMDGARGIDVMAPLEIVIDGAILDRRAKTDRPFPPVRIFASDGWAEVRSAARRAFVALGCAGYARIDMRVDDRRVPWIVDVNVSPRLSRNEYFAMSALRSGLAYEGAISRLLSVAMFARRGDAEVW